MGDKDKPSAAAESGRGTGVSPDSGNVNDDPPPPYSSSFEASVASKPPPLPREPPALTRKPSPVRTRVIPGPGLQTGDDSAGARSVWESTKDLCCPALRSIWVPISRWINCCARRCSKLKPR